MNLGLVFDICTTLLQSPYLAFSTNQDSGKKCHHQSSHPFPLICKHGQWNSSLDVRPLRVLAQYRALILWSWRSTRWPTGLWPAFREPRNILEYTGNFIKKNLLLCWGSGSGDEAVFSWVCGSGFRVRIWIQIQEGKMAYKKEKNEEISCSPWAARGLPLCLEVKIFFFDWKYYTFWSSIRYLGSGFLSL